MQNITIKYNYSIDGVEREKTVTLCAPDEQRALMHLFDAAYNAPHHDIEIIDYDVLNTVTV